jgi:hypothetical protein
MLVDQVYFNIPHMANPDSSNTSQYTATSQQPGQVHSTSYFADCSVESHTTHIFILLTHHRHVIVTYQTQTSQPYHCDHGKEWENEAVKKQLDDVEMNSMASPGQ